MRFSKARRLLAACLGGMLLLTSTAAALTGGFTYSYPIGAGTTYSRQEGYNDSGLQKASIITYTPNSTVTPIGVRSGEQFYGSRKSISQITSSLEEEGYDVLGAINADFFSFSDGVPTGLFIEAGRVIASTDWQAAVGFMADGSAIIGDPVTDIVVSGESGSIAVFDYNKTRTSRGLCLLDRYYSDYTHFSSPGQSIIMEYDDFSTLKIGEPITLTVVDKVSGSDSFAIGENQMVLSRRDDCTSMPWVDFQIGERITITFETDDPRWSEVQYAVGGKTLITDGTVTTSGIDSGTSLAARSAVGVRSDGQVVLYEVDGAQSSYSRGMTAAQLASELTALGCVNAVALDGGGSSALSVKNPSEDAAQTVTRPSDGSERRCSTFIVLLNNAPADGVPTYLHLEPSSHYILPGGTVEFSTTTLDSGFHKTTAASDVQYTATAGTVSAGQYTAPLTTGAVQVTATAGSATGSMDLYVTDEPTSMSVLKDGSAVSSLSLQTGTDTQLNGVVYRNGISIASSNGQMVWSVTGNIGTISDTGVFTATQAGTGTINVSCYGLSKSIAVTVTGQTVTPDPPSLDEAQELQVIADFESEQPLSSSDSSTLAVTADTADVSRGYRALAVNYTSGAASLTVPAASTEGKSVVTLWAKLAAGQADLRAVFAAADGTEIEVPFSVSVQSSYRQLTAEVPEQAATFQGLRMTQATETDGTLYLDHILLSEFAADNTDPPSITITDSDTTVSAGQPAQITARITQDGGAYPVREDQVYAYVDGVLSTATYDPETASIEVDTGALSAGTHVVILEAQDDAGNYSRQTVTITAGTRTDSKFTDLGSSWAAGYINLLSDRGIMTGEQAADGTWRFNPGQNLRRSEFAVLMANVLGLDTSSVGELPFDDAASIPTWAQAAVAAVTEAGVMSGQANNTTGQVNFNPDADITRAEVMSVISRCLPRGYAVQDTSFTDASSIPSWAVDAVNYVTSAGIISGYTDGSVRPNAQITRAEIASVICNFR